MLHSCSPPLESNIIMFQHFKDIRQEFFCVALRFILLSRISEIINMQKILILADDPIRTKLEEKLRRTV